MIPMMHTPVVPLPVPAPGPIRFTFDEPLKCVKGRVYIRGDLVPTENSSNYLSSGVIHTALKGKLDTPVTAGKEGEVLTMGANGFTIWSKLSAVDVVEQLPETGDVHNLYILADTNQVYRWSPRDDQFVLVSPESSFATWLQSNVDSDGKIKKEALQNFGINDITNLKTTLDEKYVKPADGIPAAHLTTSVQSSLTKANSALQSETDPTVPAWAKQPVKPTYTPEEIGTFSKDDINDKINQVAAHYLTWKNDEGEYVPFSSHGKSTGPKGSLAWAKAHHTEESPQFWYGTTKHTPDKNDYCVVLEDEEHKTDAGVAPTTRYSFVGEWGSPDGMFRYQYTINETPFSEGQWAAINSGATKEKIDAIGKVHTVKSLTRIEDYLYEATCCDLKEDTAEAYFRARFWDGTIPTDGTPLGACSAFRSGNIFGRNYDWKYDNAVSFALHTLAEEGKRHASIAICGSPDGIERAAVEGGYVPEELWDVMPFFALDGINDHGVVCNVNVVPAHENEGWNGTEFCAISGVRKVLDYATTALEGATMLAEKAWMPKAGLFGGNSLHFMIADKERTYVVEDGQVFDVTESKYKAMTNFRVGGKDFFDTFDFVDVEKVASYDEFGSGVERYNQITYGIIQRDKPSTILTNMRFTWAYQSRENGDAYTPSEFAGIATTSEGRKLRVNETAAIQDWFKREEVHTKWLARSRNGEFWQTVHSAVYDLEKRTLSVIVQEQFSGPAYEFMLDGDVSNLAKKDDLANVIELDDATKKLFVMKNGTRTDEEVASWRSLFDLTKRGLVRLYYLASGSGDSGRKALYTAHLVDDKNTGGSKPAILFDATGFIGTSTIYSRTITLTKEGADGIHVSVGTLTEVAKKSDIPTSLPWGNVTNKPTVFPPESHSHAQSEVEGLEAALANTLKPDEYGVIKAINFDLAVGRISLYKGGYASFRFDESGNEQLIITNDFGEDIKFPIHKGSGTLALEEDLADKLTDADLETLCTTCGISLTKPDGTPKTRAELLIDLFGESNSQLKSTIRGQFKAGDNVSITEDADGKMKISATGGGGEIPDYTLAWNPETGKPGYYTKD